MDREEELRALRDKLDSSGFELIVIYGRRNTSIKLGPLKFFHLRKFLSMLVGAK